MSGRVYKSQGSWTQKRRSMWRSKSPWRRRSMARYVTKTALPKQVMEIVNSRAEVKHKFHEFKSAVADNSCTVYQLSNISDGVSIQERVGENIMCTGVDVWGFWNNDDTDENVVCRFLVFRYNSQHIATPTAAEVLSTVGDNRTPNSLYFIDNVLPGRPGANKPQSPITILHDETVVVGDQGSGMSKQAFRATKRWKPFPINFQNIASSDEGPGQVYLLYCSNVSSPATYVQFNADARLYYTDV